MGIETGWEWDCRAHQSGKGQADLKEEGTLIF